MKRAIFALALSCCLAGSVAMAAEGTSTFELYGYVMLDAGYDTKQVDPSWYDVMRPTKLPAFENEFGADGSTYFGVRQTRFGVKSSTPTDVGVLKTQFEWELFGTGVDAGQTTLRLRHAYGELGKVGAGQTWSPFMDIDVFPNTIEYWGPSGMVFFRNVQIRYMPIQGDTRMTIALERPGASGDQGIYSEINALNDIRPNFPLPDLSAEYRVGRGWGYVEIAGILRYMKWEDAGTDSLDLAGDATGWGLNLSSNLKLGTSNVARMSVVFGEGIENYMNDATVDVGIEANPGNANTPIKGVALPIVGVVAFLDHTWNDRYTSSIGYSMVDIDNSDGQAASAYSRGHYAVGNLLYYPAPNVMTGIELQYGKRENFNDGFTSDDVKIQVSFRYNFSRSL
ncbi:MAG TPA: DcaP family trimeric outer membrane transporter [Candidatus Krumholzibacteria bacterium]|nr:DcaP family trimeric outer membrane transporter [Candidatus Krumholzibacteria bacterium]